MLANERTRSESRRIWLRVALWGTAVALLALAIMLPVVASAGGGLDPAFGSAGKVVTDFGQSEVVQGLAVQRDGKIVAAGTAQDQTTFATQFALARYQRNGTLDAGFGPGGKLTSGFGGNENRAFALALAVDGKIIAAGNASSGSAPSWPTGTDIALARYNPDGSLDTSFGAGGKVLTDFGLTHEGALAMVIQPDGKLVVAGSTRPFGPITSNPPDFALARYNADGSLDASFDGDGRVTTGFGPGSFDRAHAIALGPDGKIVVAGFGGIARYNSDGSLDTSFDGDGKLPLSPGREGFGLVVQPDGKVVVAGAVLARYAADGSIDSSFGTNGVVTATFGRPAGGGQALARQADGKLVAAGYLGPQAPTAEPNDFAFMVARFDSHGKLDTSFYGTGVVSTEFGTTTWDEARALALDPSGRIITGGLSAAIESSRPVNADFALAGYLAPPPRCRVPNVRGKTLTAAKRRIRAAYCSVGRVRYVGSAKKKGHLIAQTPRPGVTLPHRGKVNLLVSRGRR
jgi:uncharacterized delta-60 repeat protein